MCEYSGHKRGFNKSLTANTAMTFDVSDLSKGIYFIQLDNNAMAKFIKE